MIEESKLETQSSGSNSAWEKVEAVLKKHYHNPDIEAARAVYSAVAAHWLKGQPVWSMLVAPPGSMKTELVGAIDGLPGVHLIDQVTPSTFISGQVEEPGKIRTKPASLLHRIGDDGIIVCADFSTVLEMRPDRRGQVLAEMRRIYDGHFRKEFGTAENLKEREWKGRITFVVAVTPAIDSHYSVFSTLGERFVMNRWPRAGGVEVAIAAMTQDGQQAKSELKEAVHELFDSLPKVEPELPGPFLVRVAAIAEIAVDARTYVERARYGKDIIYVPEPESNTRLAQQLAQLAKGSALLGGRDEVTEEDIAVVRRVAFDCMPPQRKAILRSTDRREEPQQSRAAFFHSALRERGLGGVGLTRER